MNAAPPTTSWRWLIMILLGGGLLRCYGIWFGLPYPFARPDEDVATARAMELLVTGDLNPHFFHWPSLIFYLFAAVYSLAAFLNGSVQAPLLGLHEQLLLARLVVALSGTATLFVLFRIGSRVADESTGLIAACLLAVAVLHVRESHFAMTDVLMTLFVMISLLWLLRAVEEPSGRAALGWFAASGLAAGLAASTKYSGVAIAAALLPVFLARTARNFAAREAWLPVLSFGVCLVCAFVVTTPYSVLDAGNFVEGFRFTFSHLAAGQNVNVGRGWTYHLTHSLPFGVGPATFAAAIPGAVVMARRYPAQSAILGAFGAFFYLSIGSGYLVFFRYVLPLLPLACLAAAVGIRTAGNWLSGRTALSHRASVGLLVAVVAGPGLMNSVWLDVLLARADSRVVAARWLEAHLQPGDSLYDSGGKYVALDLSRTRYERVRYEPQPAAFAAGGNRRPDWLVLHESPLVGYTEVPQPVEAIAEQEYILMAVINGTPRAPGAGVYDAQDLFFLPVWGMWTVERPGPTIRIFQRKVV